MHLWLHLFLLTGGTAVLLGNGPSLARYHRSAFGESAGAVVTAGEYYLRTRAVGERIDKKIVRCRGKLNHLFKVRAKSVPSAQTKYSVTNEVIVARFSVDYLFCIDKGENVKGTSWMSDPK